MPKELEAAPEISEAIQARMSLIDEHRDGLTEWITPWIPVRLTDAVVSWKRYGRVVDGSDPGFAQILSTEGHPTSYQTWRGLVSEDQLQTLIGRLPSS